EVGCFAGLAAFGGLGEGESQRAGGEESREDAQQHGARQHAPHCLRKRARPDTLRGMTFSGGGGGRDAVIVGYVRTPIGRYGGALASVRPDTLAAHAIKTLVERTGVDPAEVDDV